MKTILHHVEGQVILYVDKIAHIDFGNLHVR